MDELMIRFGVASLLAGLTVWAFVLSPGRALGVGDSRALRLTALGLHVVLTAVWMFA